MTTHITHAQDHLAALPQDHPLQISLANTLTHYTRRAPNLTATFIHLLPEILSTTDSDFGFLAEVVYATPTTPYLHSHAVVDIYKANYTTNDIVSNLNFHNLDTLNGAILTSKAPVLSNDPANDPRSGGVPAGHMQLSCFLGFPFIIDGQLLGAFAMANKPGGYTNADIELLDPLAHIGGLLIAADRD